MHALQVVPVLSFYVLKSTTLTVGLTGIYSALAVFTLIQAFKGKPLVKGADKDATAQTRASNSR